MPSTLRTELDKLGFDWAEGQMIMQDGSGYQSPKQVQVVDKDNPVLDIRFSNGQGFMDMPRFMAADAHGVYVPYRDQHSSGLQKIYHEPQEYLETGARIPYPD